MKKIIPVLAIAVAFAACKSQSATDKNIVGTSAAAINTNSSILSDTSRITKTTVLPNGSTTTTVTTTTKPVDMVHGTTSNEVKTIPGNKTINSSPAAYNNTPSSTTPASTTASTPAKKGWSKAAVDATAAGLGGAVLGAIVSKNKVEGAVIGGAVGAGGGYVVGRAGDRKSGRVKKKKVVTTTSSN